MTPNAAICKFFVLVFISVIWQSASADEFEDFLNKLKETPCTETAKFIDGRKFVHAFVCSKIYPETPIDNSIIQILKKKDWVEQKSDVPEWELYPAMRSGVIRIVAQKEYLFVRRHKIILVAIMQSRLQTDLDFSRNQVVNIIIYPK
jgi:hypothetical protein